MRLKNIEMIVEALKAWFMVEYSRKSHKYSFIRAFLKKLNISNEFSPLSGKEVLEILNNQDFDYQDWDLYEGEDAIECPLCATDLLLDDVFV
jgi:hypothetical protein